MPIAADVPKIVAPKDAMTAIIKVLRKDDKIISLLKSFAYQSSVNPVKTDLLLD